VALNAVANGRIRAETPFEDVWVQPAAGDSGIAVGAALHVWHQELGRPRGFAMEHAYWGPEYSEDECSAALAAAGLEARRLDDDALFAHVAERIAAATWSVGSRAGWSTGPRALGHRSIVADPRPART
jgi:carbamoyltransferase